MLSAPLGQFSVCTMFTILILSCRIYAVLQCIVENYIVVEHNYVIYNMLDMQYNNSIHDNVLDNAGHTGFVICNNKIYTKPIE